MDIILYNFALGKPNHDTQNSTSNSTGILSNILVQIRIHICFTVNFVPFNVSGFDDVFGICYIPPEGDTGSGLVIVTSWWEKRIRALDFATGEKVSQH